LVRGDAEVTGRKECVKYKEKLLGILPELWKREKKRQLFLPLKEQRQQTFSKNGTVCPPEALPLQLTQTPIPL
jgi:hypothetical protein